MCTGNEMAEMLLSEYWAAKSKEVEKLIDQDQSSYAAFSDADIDERLLYPVYEIDFDTVHSWFSPPHWFTPPDYYTTACQYLEHLENSILESLSKNPLAKVETKPPDAGSIIQPPVQIQTETDLVRRDKQVENSASTKIMQNEEVPTNVNEMSTNHNPITSEMDSDKRAKEACEKEKRLQKAKEASATLLAESSGQMKVELSFSELQMPPPTKPSFTISKSTDAIVLETSDRVLVAVSGYLTIEADRLGLISKADRLPSQLTEYLSRLPNTNYTESTSVTDTHTSATATTKGDRCTEQKLPSKKKSFSSEPPAASNQTASKPETKAVSKKGRRKDANVLIISETHEKSEQIGTIEYGKIKWSEVVSERTM